MPDYSDYRIYEVFPDGSLHDTNKVISYNRNAYSIVRATLEAYNFANYYDSYYKYCDRPNDRIAIYYNYLGDGHKDTWILIKEDNNEKENDNE